ncbi:hypothetical protein Agub_g6933 [Astrephomene gubernaculifera]|uniref:Histone deacetylase domain-containing protein n=1 Tax=Astrephomene gubernaculifera TaxID=47775 RepID=A0AAD3DP95_9CHLO|nr:hypothetical protein Agub_g6933 [Astrephomene gubernaculifera]
MGAAFSSPRGAIPTMASSPTPPPQSSFSPLARVPHGTLSAAYADLCEGPWPGSGQLPVVYHPSYNISFMGFEKLHPFDSCKFAKVVSELRKRGVLREGQTSTPREADPGTVLSDVHTADYLHRIHHENFTVVQVTELPALSLLPNVLLQNKVVQPMRLHVGGTMLAAGLALERGWAINLGGGMHHAAADRGMGWCPFDDIALAVRRVRRAVAAAAGEQQGRVVADGDDGAFASAAGVAKVQAGAAEASTGRGGSGCGGQGSSSGTSGSGVLRVLLVDLDAHQGNGVERDKLSLPLPDFHILDAYNALIFPRDETAKAAIDIPLELSPGTGDEEYLGRLREALESVLGAEGEEGEEAEANKRATVGAGAAGTAATAAGGVAARGGSSSSGGSGSSRLRHVSGTTTSSSRLGGGGGRRRARGGVLPAPPDLVIYNAGTDVLAGDPLGRLGLSRQGVVARDEMVWRWCRDVARAPVVMLLSGGYTKESAGVIADSIENLFRVFGLAGNESGGGGDGDGHGGGSGGVALKSEL